MCCHSDGLLPFDWFRNDVVLVFKAIYNALIDSPGRIANVNGRICMVDVFQGYFHPEKIRKK